MRVLIINSVCGHGSTGKICSDIAQQLIRQGHECTVAYGRDGNVPEHLSQHSCRIGTDFEVKLHGLKTRLLDAHGFGSTNATKRFVSWIKDYNPDVIHLHNLHGYYIDVEVLFDFLKSFGKPVIWTLHDCWAFTGHCAYFTAAKCEKWKDKCKDCPSGKEYPATCLLESAERNFERKKRAFTGVEKMRIVVPSDWLKRLVGESFLRDYPVTVIRNGIDTELFSSTESKLREKYGIGNSRLILGVASVWDGRKGLQDMVGLSAMLGEEYKTVLIGLSSKQIEALPPNIIGISRTENQKELAMWYSAADLFVNPTHEDNYPTVNLEAQACGTPAITYDIGGSGESVPAGNVVTNGETAAELYERICRGKFEIKAKNELSNEQMCKQYLELYFNEREL